MEWWSTVKYQIGPSDTPPCGRVPGFQALSLRVSGVGCPAYALLSYGVAGRCQERKTKKLKPPQKLAIFTGNPATGGTDLCPNEQGFDV